MSRSAPKRETGPAAGDWPASFTRPPTPPFLWTPLPDESAGEALVGRTCRAGEPLAPGVVAPAGGRIDAIETVRTIGGRITPAARLVVDSAVDETTASPSLSFDRAMADIERIGPEDLTSFIERFASAGIHADRWTSPDLTRQLHAAANTAIRAVACAAVDVDPELNVNATLLRDAPHEAAAGIALIGRLAGAGAWLVVDENAPPKPLEPARDAARLARVRTVSVAAGFPQSHPALLLRKLMNVSYSVGHLPVRAGVVWLDAAAAVAVGRWFMHGRAMTHTPLGVYDGRSARRRRLLVPRGAKVRDVLTSIDLNIGGLTLLAGGPLRDRRVALDDVIDADETILHALSLPTPTAPEPCVRCGDCLAGCPVRIDPAGILDAAQRSDFGRADALGLAACIECGVCTFICPSRLPLLQTIRSLQAVAKG